MQTERSEDKALLSKYSKLDITWMIPSTLKCTCKIVIELEDQHTNQLKEVYKKADRSGVASSV